MWAMLSAPLIAGNDVRKMSDETRSILTNAEVIAIDQDLEGRQGMKIDQTGDEQIWVKPLASGARAVALINRGPEAASMTVAWSRLDLPRVSHLRDLWRHADIEPDKSGYTTSVPSHGIVMLRVF